MSASVLTAGTPVDNLATQPNNFDFTVPAGAVEGDIVYVGTSLNSGTDTCPTPTGWTLMATSMLTASNFRTYLFGRKLTAADTDASKGTWNFAWTGGGRLTAAYQIVTGADALSEVVCVGATNTGGSTITSPNATATEGDCVQSTFWFGRALVSASFGITPGTSATKDAESNTNVPSTPNFTCMVSHRTAQIATPGTYGGNTATPAQSLTHDHIYTIITTSAVAANVTPTANAGPDQTGIEPYATVNLHGSGTDPDGTISNFNWTQIPQAGVPTCTIVGSGADRTVKMPGSITGYTASFQLTVTDDDGAVSTPDTMTVTVLPVTERAAIGGVLVPMEVRTA